MLVDRFLERSAGARPGKTAIVAGSRRITYEELERQANQLAHGLQSAGLRRYDRVAVYLDNSPETAMAVFATLKAGGIFTVIHPSTKSGRLAHMLNDCRAAVVITDGIRARHLAEASPHLTHLRLIVSTDTDAVQDRSWPCRCATWPETLDGQPDVPPAKTNIDVDLAGLFYTSGSTGAPKAVMMTHRSIASVSTSVGTYLENSADDIILNVLPLSFGYGLYQLLTSSMVGGTLVLEHHFNYPHRTLEIAAREQVTGFPIIPTISALLLRMDLAKYPLPSLRYITNAAAALPVAHIRQLRERFPSVRIFSMYGMTECTRVSYLPPEQIDIRPASVGRAIPNEELFIVDEDGHDVPAGTVGELVVRGSHVMSGYWERPEETNRALRPGTFPGERVLFTGDLFRADEEGYLYFIGRKDDIIKTRGQKVSPREVEEVLTSLDGVAEAAVIGVPDPVLGQAVKAVVTLRDGSRLTEAAILRRCSDRLEDFMVPKTIEIRADLPKSPHGKIARDQLLHPEVERA